MPRLLVVISALAQLYSTVALPLVTGPTLPLSKPKSAHVDARLTADAENNDARVRESIVRVDQHTRETLPLVTPGLYLDAPEDAFDYALDYALDCALPQSGWWWLNGTEDAAPTLIRVCGGSGWVVSFPCLSRAPCGLMV